MWFVSNALWQMLEHIESLQLATIRRLNTMSEALDRLTAAVDANGTATDGLSDSVSVLLDWVKSHPAVNNDPELLALAAKVEADNAKAVAAKDTVDAAVAGISASGGEATP